MEVGGDAALVPWGESEVFDAAIERRIKFPNDYDSFGNFCFEIVLSPFLSL